MWSSRTYLEHFFLGQTNLINEISPLVDSLIDTNLNFLLRAPSGYGKTYLANCIMQGIFSCICKRKISILTFI